MPSVVTQLLNDIFRDPVTRQNDVLRNCSSDRPASGLHNPDSLALHGDDIFPFAVKNIRAESHRGADSRIYVIRCDSERVTAESFVNKKSLHSTPANFFILRPPSVPAFFCLCAIFRHPIKNIHFGIIITGFSGHPKYLWQILSISFQVML